MISNASKEKFQHLNNQKAKLSNDKINKTHNASLVKIKNLILQNRKNSINKSDRFATSRQYLETEKFISTQSITNTEKMR